MIRVAAGAEIEGREIQGQETQGEIDGRRSLAATTSSPGRHSSHSHNLRDLIPGSMEQPKDCMKMPIRTRPKVARKNILYSARTIRLYPPSTRTVKSGISAKLTCRGILTIFWISRSPSSMHRGVKK
jgi:hypothetical protein